MSVEDRVKIIMIIAAICFLICIYVAERKSKNNPHQASIANNFALVLAGSMAGALFAGGFGHLSGVPITVGTVIAILFLIAVLILGGIAIGVIKLIKWAKKHKEK